MRFGGIQKLSLLDYPDRISTVLFTIGCNLRCPFCHNWRLLKDNGPSLSGQDALEILEPRKRWVSAVVVTGGEPTMYDDLPVFIENLRKRGFTVKLDTNGFFPYVLEECLPFIDYVAVDVKTCQEKYRILGAIDVGNLSRTIEIVRNGSVDYEFRSTVVPGIVTETCVHEIGRLVKGAKRFVFQQFVPGDTLDKAYSTIKPYPPETIARFAGIMRSYVLNVQLRL